MATIGSSFVNSVPLFEALSPSSDISRYFGEEVEKDLSLIEKFAFRPLCHPLTYAYLSLEPEENAGIISRGMRNTAMLISSLVICPLALIGGIARGTLGLAGLFFASILPLSQTIPGSNCLKDFSHMLLVGSIVSFIMCSTLPVLVLYWNDSHYFKTIQDLPI